jgi:hypothetical protein
MDHCNIVATPLELNLKLFKSQTLQNDFKQYKMSNISYDQEVGTLTCASYITCLDLDYVMGEIS